MPHHGSPPTRVGALAVGLLLLALTACGSGDSPTIAGQGPTTSSTSPSSGARAPSTTGATTPATATTAPGTVLAVTVRAGSVEGASRQRATLNQPVTVRVTSDVADEVHVHGYDKRVEVAAGRTGEVTFVANIPGVFEVEFEKSRKLLFTLEVR